MGVSVTLSDSTCKQGNFRNRTVFFEPMTAHTRVDKSMLKPLKWSLISGKLD